MALDADVRAALAGALDAGYWIAVPESPVTLAGRDMIGWWRMDPGSGEVLGMMRSGAGEGYTEYIIITAMIIVPGNIAAFFHTLVAAPFDDNDQSALEVITCALVGAICPSVFGYSVPVDGSYDSCSVRDSISGIRCPLDASGSSSSSSSSSSSGGSGGATLPSDSCSNCGHSLQPRGG